MAKRKRWSSGNRTKRTITPEHLAKMQEGRKRAAVQRKRMAELKDSGLYMEQPVSPTERLLNSVKRH